MFAIEQKMQRNLHNLIIIKEYYQKRQVSSFIGEVQDATPTTNRSMMYHRKIRKKRNEEKDDGTHNFNSSEAVLNDTRDNIKNADEEHRA